MVSTKEIAARWGISERRVRALCEKGQIAGAKRKGKLWKIPQEAIKPVDGRYKKDDSLTSLLQQAKERYLGLSFTPVEQKALREEFCQEFLLSSEAIEQNPISRRELVLILKGIRLEKHSDEEQKKVKAHKEALLYCFELADSKAPLNLWRLKQLYALLGGEKSYRRLSLPSYLAPVKIEVSLEELFKSERELSLEDLSGFLIALADIHPYMENNGRVLRLVIVYGLLALGFPPFASSPKEYAAFEEALKEKKKESVLFFLRKGVLESLNRAESLFK